MCNNNPTKNIKLLFCGKKAHFKLDIISDNPNVIVNKEGIDHTEIHKYIQSCHLTTSDYNSPTANWGGCMHILESMACGTPIVCGDFDVRKEQLGDDYPLYWKYKDNDNDIIIQIYNILQNTLYNKFDMGKIQEDIISRSNIFTTSKISKGIYQNLENIACRIKK